MEDGRVGMNGQNEHNHDVLSFRLSGAGGYGDPAEREAWRIEDDLADGYITAAGAQGDYGVLLRDGKVV
jgi:N-methylhydantoinase B